MSVRMKNLMALLTLVVAAGACAKKAPPVVPSQAAAAPREVAAAPAPAIRADEPVGRTELDIWSRDLTEIEVWARREGLLGDVYFDFDRFDLSTEARERLTRNAEFLRQHPELVVTIEGHCDERGTNDYNLALGDRRAFSASDYVQSLGVGGQQLRNVSYGEERPQCRQSNESCWAKNRRAAFLLTGRTIASAESTGGS